MIIDLTHPLDNTATRQSTYPGDPPYACTPFLTIAHDGCSVHRLALGSHTGTHVDAPSHFVSLRPQLRGEREREQNEGDEGGYGDGGGDGGESRLTEKQEGEEEGGEDEQAELSRASHAPIIINGLARGATIDQIPLSHLVNQSSVLVVDVNPSGNLGARSEIGWDGVLGDAVGAATTAREALGGEHPPPRVLLIRTGWSRYWGTPKYFEHPYLSKEVAERIVRGGSIRIVGIDTLSPDQTPYNGVGADAGFGVHETLLGANVLIVENLTNLRELGDGRGFVVSLVPLNIAKCDGSPIRAYAVRK